MRLKTVILVVLILVITNIVTFMGARALTPAGMHQLGGQAPVEDIENADQFELLQEILEVLDQNYLEEFDRQELKEGAIEGMLDVLDDPQTTYMTPEDYENLMIQTEGAYGGIGIEVFKEDDYVTIVAPIAGTPGEEKGLRSGDKILAVDGKDIVGVDLNEAVEMMRGEPGTAVILEIERPGVEEVLKFEIEREEIELDSVEYALLENGFAHLKVTTFQRTTGEEFREALNKAEADQARGIILDLRDNPGGLLDAAIDVAEQIVPEGPIVHVVGREEKLDTYYSEGEGVDTPMVVLVNQVSASASEILAGALQDTGAAQVVGTETFGKASVQNIQTLTTGGALRYTMAKYQTPEGRDIHETGLTPDVQVEPAPIAELAAEPVGAELALGDEGKEVENLQKVLDELGYYEGEITGHFNDATQTALEDFQQDRQLEVTGEMSHMVLNEFQEAIDELLEEEDKMLEKAIEILESEVD